MTNKYYSDERSIQILISLLKQHGIRKVIASPGATNITFVGSIQHDDFFEIYSCVDERSAAYMACGIAADTGEPVVLSCTGATASRNYTPGLTEAYYRKLPVIAVTSTQNEDKIGHMVPQVIDRSSIQNDIACESVHIPVTNNADTEWSNSVKINKAILGTKHHGGGPVHINLATSYSKNFSIEKFPDAQFINRIMPYDKFPDLKQGKVAIFVGNHRPFSQEETEVIDAFCAAHNACVFCDHTSNYHGKYKILLSILTSQEKSHCFESHVDLLIHIGEISGGYISLFPKRVWRVSEDGQIRDNFRTLSCVFEMKEIDFFKHYAKEATDNSDSLYNNLKNQLIECWENIPENIPFSNVWVASRLSGMLPDNSVLHLGILNTLRSWNLFDIPNNVHVYCNTGGFGIDGCVSSMIGASITNPDKLYFGIVGDLAFFYDMNSIGNRHVGNNVRLMIINNGKGTEFRNYRHDGAIFGDEADKYIAAAGHFGNKSSQLIRDYSQALGYVYISASTKQEFESNVAIFTNPEIGSQPIVFEIFTDNESESEALRMVYTMKEDKAVMLKSKARKLLGEKLTNIVKNIIGR